MKKLKVVHVEDRFHPDMGYQLNFTAKFHDAQIDMHIVCSDSLKLWDNQALTKELIREKDLQFEEKNGITIHRLPARYEKKQGYNLLIKGLISKIYELQPDVLFVHAMESYTGIQLLSNRKVYKDFIVCTDTHTLNNQFTGSFLEKVYFEAFRKLVLNKLRRTNSPVFYTATENKDILLENYRLNAKQIFPYLIGTDDSLFFPDEHAGIGLRREIGIDPNSKIILYAGKFNEPKAPHLIIDALNTIKTPLSNIVLLMVGGKSEPYYSSKFSKTTSTNNVNIIIKEAVKVHELNAYYNMADVVVFPKENTLSALDAQLCQRPVIMEEDATNLERLIHGGLTYQKGNLEDLGRKIVKLIEDDYLREELGSKGRTYIIENFAYQSIISNMEKVLTAQMKKR